MASSSNSFSESSFLDVNIQNSVTIEDLIDYYSCNFHFNFHEDREPIYDSDFRVDWEPQIIGILKNFNLDGHITGQSVRPPRYLIDSSGEKSPNPDCSFWIQKETTVISFLYTTIPQYIREKIHDIDILENILDIDFPTEPDIRLAIDHLSARQIWRAIELINNQAESGQPQPKLELLRESLRAIEHPVPDSDTQSMAVWSLLPQDLLRSISKRLEICFDFTHCLYVCRSWRSSVLLPPEPCLLPARLPLTPYDCQSIKSFYLAKLIILLVRFPKNPDPRKPDDWVLRHGKSDHWVVLPKKPDHGVRHHRLVKIEGDIGKGMHLLNPLSNSRINGSGLLDFMNCQVIELSRQYVVHYDVYYDHPLEPGYRGYTRKVAFLGSSTKEENYYVLLVDHWYQKFAMLSSIDEQWTILENTPQLCEDIISFNGKFYALYKDGRTMVVEPSLNVSFLAAVDSRAERQFLVESGGHLLLVQRFLATNLEMEMADKQNCFRSPAEMVWFKVYKLNKAGQEWEHVKRLGDHVLFLGKDGAFFASASEFPWSIRNFIVFSLSNFDRNVAEDMFVYYYEDGRVQPLENYPGFSKFFSPPPDWVTSTTHRS